MFLYDRVQGTIERVSVTSAEVQANSTSYLGQGISGDGRFVAFTSSASNLVTGDTNGVNDVFVRDRLLGVTERVSLAAGGVQATSSSSRPSISDDGRYVAFESLATNLVPNDTNAKSDIFVYDRELDTIERVSLDSAGVQGDKESYLPSISGDGRYVAFRSLATNFVAADTNNASDVFVYDRQTDTIQRVSQSDAGIGGNAESIFPDDQQGRAVRGVRVCRVEPDRRATRTAFGMCSSTTGRRRPSAASAWGRAASPATSVQRTPPSDPTGSTWHTSQRPPTWWQAIRTASRTSSSAG